jgi:hypothetical protein
MDQVALVLQQGKVAGWVAYDMLHTGKRLIDCVASIDPNSIVSADTPVLDVTRAFTAETPWFYFVLQGHEFHGWLSYQDLHKLPFQVCLFALLLSVEQSMLEVAQGFAQDAISLLSEGRRRKAEDVFDQRGYRVGEDGAKAAHRVLECTSFVDKFTVLRRKDDVAARAPALHSELRNVAERLRNAIAHPGPGDRTAALLGRDELWPFIQWAEQLQDQMQSLLGTGVDAGEETERNE